MKPEPGREGCGAGWPRAVPRKWGSWGKPGRTGDHPKSKGGASGSRLPRSPPPIPLEAAESPPPGSCGPSPGDGGGGPAGSWGAAGARAGPRETSAASGGPCPGAGGGAASAVWRARKRQARQEKPQELAGGRERRAAGPRGFPRGLPAPTSSGAPLPPPAALRALPAATGSERKRNAGLPAAGRRGQRAGNGGGRERGEARRQEAPRSGWSWEDAAAAAAAATSPKGPGARRTLPAPGRDQVAVEISSGGERVCGAKCGCEGSARG